MGATEVAPHRAGSPAPGACVLAVGVMSGTSLDGADAALVRLWREGPRIRAHLLAHAHHAYPEPVIARLRAIQETGSARLEELADLGTELGAAYGEVALAAAAAGGGSPAFIACHGQTIFHRPPGPDRRGVTWQLGDAAVVASRTGLPVVSGFRGADIAAGGHGAPMVPLPDWHLFGSATESRCVQNIGGIANVTWLPAGGTPEDTLAFDTGPGVMAIDAAVHQMTAGRLAFDRDGEIARRGRVDETALAELLAHPFFRRRPPKSTGRETFGRAFVDGAAERVRAPEDLVATLTALTAESIAAAYRRYLPPPHRVLVGGGGARNPVLMDALRARLGGVPVDSTLAAGVPPASREAMAFALLGYLTLQGLPGNRPGATGAGRRVVGGQVTPAPDGRPFAMEMARTRAVHVCAERQSRPGSMSAPGEGGGRLPGDADDARAALSHVLWLGGASDSGKTTIARLLSHRHRWQLYPCDLHEHNHFTARANPVLQPVMYGGYGKSVDESWVFTTPEELLANVLVTNDERFPMICRDLRAMPDRPPILVEGPRLFPKLVAPLLSDVRQAVWLLPTEAFALESAAQRDKPQGRFRSSDPERYRQNFLGREALLRAHIRHEVVSAGLPWIEVDGGSSVEQVAGRVAAHFLSYLTVVQGGE